MTTWIGCPEANFHRGRPFGLRPEAVVMHIMDGSFAAGESVFHDPTTQKSAHYGISKTGEIHQYVDDNDTAFHAGIVVNPTWSLLKPRINPNFYTIGIEHEGRADDVWPEAQLAASACLISEIAERWRIPLDDSHVIQHRQIRASKTCPGNWLQIGALLKRVPVPLPKVMSSPVTADEANGNHPPEPGSSSHALTVPSSISRSMMVRTVKKVNLRRGRPSTTASVVRVIPAQTDVVVCKCEIGEPVEGNAHWYGDVQGNFFWAGATETPDPAVLESPELVRA